MMMMMMMVLNCSMYTNKKAEEEEEKNETIQLLSHLRDFQVQIIADFFFMHIFSNFPAICWGIRNGVSFGKMNKMTRKFSTIHKF